MAFVAVKTSIILRMIQSVIQGDGDSFDVWAAESNFEMVF
jgi:hypothetical protein